MLGSDGAEIAMLPLELQHPSVHQAGPVGIGAENSPEGLAGHQALLDRLSSQVREPN